MEAKHHFNADTTAGTSNIIGVYYGRKTDDLETHITKFEFHLAMKIWPKNQRDETPDSKGLLKEERARIGCFLTTLGGNAREFFHGIKWGTGDNQIGTLQGLLDAFRLRFQRNPSDKWGEEIKLLTTKQAAGEKVKDYIRRMESSGRPNQINDYNTLLAIRQGFLRLIPNWIAHHETETQNLDDIRKLALRAEASTAEPTEPDLLTAKMDQLLAKFQTIETTPVNNPCPQNP